MRLGVPKRFRAMVLLFMATCGVAVLAEPQGFKGTPVLHAPLSGDDAREAVVGTAEFARGGTTGRHTHPGDEYGVVLEGTLELRVEGREPRRVSAGEAFHNPKGVVHETRNVGSGSARVVSTFVVEKGRRLTEPAE
jgi:quercetin dioxygenase-like cupin family protein